MSPAASPAGAAVHLGANVYCHGAEHQNHLLGECFGPLIHRLRRSAVPVRFWFDRFDARGPHVFALWSVPPAAASGVRDLLARELASFLAEHPSREVVPAADLKRFHTGCQGKALCAADREHGIAANNSFCLFEQPADGYPFHLGCRLRQGDELWELLDEVAVEALSHFGGEPAAAATEPALRWVADLDRALAALGEDPSGYWLYHGTTLLFRLEQLACAPEEDFLARLARRVGPRNQETFARIWAEAATKPLSRTVQHIVEIAGTTVDLSTSQRWAVLREVVHCTLKQFGVPVPLHLPIVLFALHLHRSRRWRSTVRPA